MLEMNVARKFLAFLHTLHCLEEEVRVLLQQADVLRGELGSRVFLFSWVSDRRFQYEVAPLGQYCFQHTADDRPVSGVGLDPQRWSTVPAACVDAPAGVAGLVVLGRCFVLHWGPAGSAADETVQGGFGGGVYGHGRILLAGQRGWGCLCGILLQGRRFPKCGRVT